MHGGGTSTLRSTPRSGRGPPRTRCSAGAPAPLVVLGGDTNVRRPVAPGFRHQGENNVDHVLARGRARVGAAKLEAGPLSDHAPVLVELRPPEVVERRITLAQRGEATFTVGADG